MENFLTCLNLEDLDISFILYNVRHQTQLDLDFQQFWIHIEVMK